MFLCLVTPSRSLVQSPLASCKLWVLVTSCGEEFPQTARCEEPLPSVVLTLPLRAFTVTLPLGLEEVIKPCPLTSLWIVSRLLQLLLFEVEQA